MIQYQILKTNITRTLWQTVRRVTKEILEVKGLTVGIILSLACRSISKIASFWMKLLNATLIIQQGVLQIQ